MKDAEVAYGIFMQSYFGGRAECRIRNWEVPVCPVDFMSQYPTVNELLGNWEVLTAESVTFPDATDEVRQASFSQSRWNGVLIASSGRNSDSSRSFVPTTTFLPVRTVYNGTTQNIGINYLTSKEPIWFAGPDIIASILLTGKVPHIEKAIRVVAARQTGGIGFNIPARHGRVDAKKHSFFKHVIEQRAAHESRSRAPLLAEDSRQQRIVWPIRGTQSERCRRDKAESIFRGRVV